MYPFLCPCPCSRSLALGDPSWAMQTSTGKRGWTSTRSGKLWRSYGGKLTPPPPPPPPQCPSCGSAAPHVDSASLGLSKALSSSQTLTPYLPDYLPVSTPYPSYFWTRSSLLLAEVCFSRWWWLQFTFNLRFDTFLLAWIMAQSVPQLNSTIIIRRCHITEVNNSSEPKTSHFSCLNHHSLYLVH